MSRVPFDFCRTPFVTCYEEALTKTVVLRCGGKSERLAGNDNLRLVDVGNNFFERLFRAGAQSCQRQGGTAEAEKFSTAEAHRPL